MVFIERTYTGQITKARYIKNIEINMMVNAMIDVCRVHSTRISPSVFTEVASVASHTVCPYTEGRSINIQQKYEYIFGTV